MKQNKITPAEFHLSTVCVFPNGMEVVLIAPDMTQLGYAWNRITNGARKLFPEMIETVRIEPK